MPLAKGLILLTYFSITCGILTAINVALLRGVGGVPAGVISVAPSLIIAFLETLALLGLVDYCFLKRSVKARRDHATVGEKSASVKSSAGRSPPVPADDRLAHDSSPNTPGLPKLP